VQTKRVQSVLDKPARWVLVQSVTVPSPLVLSVTGRLVPVRSVMVQPKLVLVQALLTPSVPAPWARSIREWRRCHPR
jgi:hypothetical protein